MGGETALLNFLHLPLPLSLPISPPPRPADLWHNFPQTMKKMNSATWMLSGDDFLENGDITCTFTKHNLKELQVCVCVHVCTCVC